MPRPSQAKENLIKAATDLIWENSYGSTSVDDICVRAEVRKGSFYHFFESKSHLTIASIDAAWSRCLPVLNENFSPLIPPLARFQQYAETVLATQLERYAQTGHVAGCPLSSLGSEMSSQDEEIRQKIVAIFAQHLRFYESAIRDAAREKLIVAADPAFMAETLQTFIQGAFTHARVLNDLTPIRRMGAGMLGILGVPPVVAKLAPPATTPSKPTGQFPGSKPSTPPTHAPLALTSTSR